MLIYGHRFIPSKTFYHVANIDAIMNTPPNSTIFLDFSEENLETINHASINGISFALSVSSINEVVYASVLGAEFIVVARELAKVAQDIATNYLFDTKILASIEDEEQIEELAIEGIDGVIFSEAIIKITS